ncbi:tautomerase family protein [Aquiluna borgnonia]|uniref:Tautomerase family protein n=1 Tax=Aquiluna borgnonia TaxID=2499157 RepID=A0A7D4PZG4_9MICO|nr:tautomerase family protein [Aquiluna borgnonia]QKJ25685.1 tautomerase family protein [Aquiluna borgnonia]
MPLVRIDLVKGRATSDVQKIADAIHEALVEVMEIPVRDRFQVVTQHDAFEVVAEDAGLGFERDDSKVMIQIITQRGRTQNLKQRLYQRITSKLTITGVTPNNVFISYTENTPADWSFGFGKAQFLLGELKSYAS